jgi:AcrR family transcriptional regulator
MEKNSEEKQPSSVEPDAIASLSPRERKRQHLRKALIDAGRKVFCETHYVTATVEDIASRAKLSRPTFYRYFRDKEAVLREILMLDVEVQSALWRKLAALGNPTDKQLSAWFEQFIKLMRKNAPTVALFHVAMGIDATFAHELSGIRDRYIAILGEGIPAFRLKGNGSRRDEKHRALAHLLLYQVDQVCTNMAFPGGNLVEEMMVAGLTTNFRQFIQNYS